MIFGEIFRSLKQRFQSVTESDDGLKTKARTDPTPERTAYTAPPLAGRIFTSGKRPDHEARHIESPRLATYLRHVVENDARVPGKEIVQDVPLKYRGGAYASDGTLIPESCLWRLLASGMDCATVPYSSLPDPTASLSVGVFGGTLFPHFGHLMVESTARLWWLLKNEPSLPLILQFQAETDVVPSYFQKLFALAGIKTHIVPRGHLVEVKRLIIPEPALVERKHAHPDFLLFFDKVRTAALSHGKYPDYGRHLFVMRGQGVAQVFGEDVVCKELERQGYRMLDPSVVNMEEQISAFAGATHIVGSIGSAMHNVVYASEAQKVAYLVRTGSVSTTFPSIDQACGLYEAHYLYVGLTPLPVHGPLKGPYLIDAEMACHHLFEAGFLPHRVNLALSDVIASRDAYMAQWAAGASKQT